MTGSEISICCILVCNRYLVPFWLTLSCRSGVVPSLAFYANGSAINLAKGKWSTLLSFFVPSRINLNFYSGSLSDLGLKD